MKKYLKFLCCLTLVLGMMACKKISNFLDKAPAVDVTEDVIFSSKTQLDIFINTMYKYGVYSIAAYLDASLSTTRTVAAIYQPLGETASDEGESNIPFGQANTFWNNGNLNSSNIVNAEDTRYFQRWISLYQCNIIIERVPQMTDPSMTDAYKKQVVGEAKFIRALNYMEMIKRYGGVPIVNKRFNPGDDINVPRSTFEDCIKFIVADCDDAIAAGLPLTQASAQRGRATSLAAMALKAKALLYAASPLFNTGTPYMSMSNAADNKLICYGNEDPNRWKLAADAARAALDVVENSGGVYGLIDNLDNRDPQYLNPARTNLPTSIGYTSGLGFALGAGNYKQSWEVLNNSEVIFDEQGNGARRVDEWPVAQNYPKPMGNTSRDYGVSVLQNFVSQYENKTTGQLQTWPGGNDLVTKYDQLDPRFKQTVAFNGNYFNAQVPNVATFASTDGNAALSGANYDRTGIYPTAMYLKKYVSDAQTNGGPAQIHTWPLLRVNELYLNYAEAYNEANGGPGGETIPTKVTAPSGIVYDVLTTSTTAYDALNRVRLRSKMPILPAGLTKEQFRDRVRHERQIELAFEDQRFWDVRRWKIADQDGVMRGSMYGQKINKLSAGGFGYTIYPYETRVFNTYEYLDGFDLTEVRKGNLIQNPGW